jgi:hypothetical protein
MPPQTLLALAREVCPSPRGRQEEEAATPPRSLCPYRRQPRTGGRKERGGEAGVEEKDRRRICIGGERLRKNACWLGLDAKCMLQLRSPLELDFVT